MEIINIQSKIQHYSVFIENKHTMRHEGSVYLSDISDDKKPYFYNREKGSEIEDEINSDCQKLFDFSFCWRGVWEGRIYFVEDEYFSDDLADIVYVWDKIQSHLKDKIKKENIDYIFD